MELLSNIEKSTPKVTFDAGHLQVLDIAGYTAIQESDMIVCIPYLIENNNILLRYENIPTYQIVRPEIDKYLTVMSTVMDKNETPLDTLKRGLLTEYGLKLTDNCKPEILTPIFINKGNTARYHICILPLMSYDFEQVQPSEVQALQMKSNNIILHITELKNVIIYDLITRYTIDLFKQHYSLF
jgi:hypothetical protein